MKYKMIPGHPLGENDLPLKVPYVLALDTPAMMVQDYHQFDEGTPLPIIKATLVNVMYAFTTDYRNDVLKLFNAGQTAGKLTGKPKFAPEYIESVIARSDMLHEQAKQRVLGWDGDRELTVLLPYARIVEQDKDIIDLNASKLQIFGMMWAVNCK